METLIFNHAFAGADWGFQTQQFVDYPAALRQKVKIAALPVMFDEPGNFCYAPDMANLDFDQFDLILLSSIEPVSPDSIVEWVKQKNFKQCLISTGSLERGQSLPGNAIYRPWWAFNIVNSNNIQPTPDTVKPFAFDVLLGARRKHRDFVMLSLQQNNLLDKNIVSYRGIFTGNETDDPSVMNYFSPTTLNWPYISAALTPELEVKETLDRSISSCVPWKIYQNTYYSIIAETLGTGGAFFLSEKTGKAFYAKRPFVHIGTQGFLAQLKKLGFETFDSVWNENYDTIEDPLDRWQQAMNTAAEIATQDPMQVLTQCHGILEHNFNHLLKLKKQTREQQLEMIGQCL